MALAAHDAADLVRALPAHLYTDPLVFAEEQRAIFERTWQYACHVSQLRHPGDYIAVGIGRARVVVVCSRDDTLKAFHNVCRHRAHALVEGSGNRSFLVCPYHGWRYDLNGRLKSAPGEHRVTGFDPTCLSLKEIRVETMAGFVFVNLDPDARPMSEWYPGVEAELRSYVPDVDAIAPLAAFPVEEACNWKVSVENYSECYHCRLAHPTFSSGVVDPDSYNVRPQGHCLRHTTKMARQMIYAVKEGHARAPDYSSWYLWPTFSFQVYPGGVLNTYLWRCRDHGSVTVWRGWYGAGGMSQEAVDRLARQDLDTTVAEDVAIVESVQRGLASGAYEPGPLVVDPDGGVMSEHSIATLHTWWREAMSNVLGG